MISKHWPRKIWISERDKIFLKVYWRKLTLSSTVELHIDLLIHILGEVEDVFLLGLLLLLRTATSTATSVLGGVGATAASPVITSAAASGAPSERASIGHGLAATSRQWAGGI